MATLTWLGHASFRLDTDGGKRIYVDPWLTGPTRCPDSREGARARRRDRPHARPRRPRRRRGRACSRSSGATIVAQVELKGWLGAERRDRRRDAGLNKGGTHRGRRHPVHADERVPLELGADDGDVPRRGRAGSSSGSRRQVDLLRRRHVRLRRHGADRPPLRARRRGAADRRPLHDGAGGGRASRSSCSATRAASRATGARSRSSPARPTSSRS